MNRVTVLLVVFAIASTMMITIGVAPRDGYAAMWGGTFATAEGFGQVLFRLTTLIMCGLAVSVPLRAGLFNVAAESQLIVGGFACALVGAALPEATPAVIAVPLCLLAAATAGASLGFGLAVMRTHLGIHEVIGGLLGNLIVRAVMIGLGAQFYLRESVHTLPVIAAAVLPRASKWIPAMTGSALNAALLLALILLAVVPIWQARSRRGFLLSAVGENVEAVRAAGASVPRLEWFAMAAGGALGGLASANFVLGYKHFYEGGFSGGVGFLGLAVAMRGRDTPGAIFSAALLLAVLQQGGFAMNRIVPKDIADVLAAVLLAGSAVAIAATHKKSPAGPAW